MYYRNYVFKSSSADSNKLFVSMSIIFSESQDSSDVLAFLELPLTLDLIESILGFMIYV